MNSALIFLYEWRFLVDENAIYQKLKDFFETELNWNDVQDLDLLEDILVEDSTELDMLNEFILDTLGSSVQLSPEEIWEDESEEPVTFLDLYQMIIETSAVS